MRWVLWLGGWMTGCVGGWVGRCVGWGQVRKGEVGVGRALILVVTWKKEGEKDEEDG